MVALQIADIRFFMKKLLLSSTFDHFLLLEGSITTFNTFHISGILKKSYFTIKEQEAMEDRSLSYWEEVRPFCFELIRGKRTPLAFHFTFQLSAPNMERFLAQAGTPVPADQIRGLLLNLRYDGSSLLCTTGTSLSVFLPDKNLDHAWDDMVQKFFHQQEIPYELV